MEKDRLTRYFFIGVIAVLLYFTFLLLKPFLTYIILSIILTYITYPVYKKINSKIKRKEIAAGLTIVIILLILIIPSIFIVQTLIVEATNAVNVVKEVSSDRLSGFMAGFGMGSADVEGVLKEFLNRFGSFVVNSASKFLSSIPEAVLGFFVLFFVMYYGFKEGEELYKSLENHIPIKIHHKEKLLKRIHNVTHAVLFGQILTAAIQGIIGGIGFLIFGLPNPVFWGFIMIILSFIPMVGTPLVWIPAGIIAIVNGNDVGGIGILIYGVILIMNIDNVLKPKLISGRAELHPVAIMIGVLGGLATFGFAGIVLGPLIIAILTTMLKFYTEEKSFTV